MFFFISIRLCLIMLCSIWYEMCLIRLWSYIKFYRLEVYRFTFCLVSVHAEILILASLKPMYSPVPSPLGVNAKHARLSTPNTEITINAPFYHFLERQFIDKYFERWRLEIRGVSRVIWDQRKNWGHVIKVIQGYEINVKIELPGSVRVKPYNWFELLLLNKYPSFASKSTCTYELSSLNYPRIPV